MNDLKYVNCFWTEITNMRQTWIAAYLIMTQNGYELMSGIYGMHECIWRNWYRSMYIVVVIYVLHKNLINFCCDDTNRSNSWRNGWWIVEKRHFGCINDTNIWEFYTLYLKVSFWWENSSAYIQAFKETEKKIGGLLNIFSNTYYHLVCSPMSGKGCHLSLVLQMKWTSTNDTSKW